ncbi:MAG: patatin-like phospholipase family protein, partial [Elusimicrobiaceae bacterium]|nr:patatin-like phospholipase family protein [Elusimicrobiaceae bacterium]
SGMSVEKLWDIGRKASLRYATNDVNAIGLIRLITAERLFSSSRMEDFINTSIGDMQFSDLRIPFACVAMDIRTGAKVVFEDGDVGLAVRASMNIPGMFEPVRYRHYELVDGGVIDNVPVDVAKKMGADWVFTSLIQGDLSKTSFNTVYAYLMQVMDVRGSILVQDEIRDSNFILRPPVGHINFVAFEKAYYAGRTGLEEAYRHIDEAKDNVMLFSMDSIYGAYAR